MPNKATYEYCIDQFYAIEPISYFELGKNIHGEKGCYTGPDQYRAPGYLEGTGFWTLLWRFGGEVVYDFATMEKGNFGYFGAGGNDALDSGGGVQFYYGTVMGLRTDSNIIDQYRGISANAQIGLSVDLGVGIGAGVGGFVSYNDPMVRGTYVYDGASLSADFLEGADIDVSPMLFYAGNHESLKSYKLRDGTIDRMSLAQDILTGVYSPTPFLNPLAGMRLVGIALAFRYADIYEELHGESNSY